MNPLSAATWGVFLLRGKEAKIIPPKLWPLKDGEAVSMALQVGPRLVIDGKVQKFKEGLPARRSALGITSSGWIEIALSETPLLLKEWAALLKNDCPQAINLDGGGSSQLSIEQSNLSLNVEGLTNIPNVVGVFRK